MLPRWILGVYLALFAASVPWYVPSRPAAHLAGTAPLGGAVACRRRRRALFTLFVVSRHWPEEEGEDGEAGGR